MSKHTPEPWVNESPYISGKVKGGRPNGEIIASVRGFVPEAEDFGLSAANTKRIVACVNALAGVEDPQAYLADLRRRIGELEAENERLRNAASVAAMPHSNPTGDTLHGPCPKCIAEAALSPHPQKGE